MRRRERFLSDMRENILVAYQVPGERYAEDMVGEFDTPFEEEYFRCFAALSEPQGLVLDLACGDSRHTLRLSEHTSRVVGFDLSTNMLKKARKKCSVEPTITFGQG